MLLKIKKYLFEPRFHFNRLEFNLFGLFFIAVGVLLSFGYLTNEYILPKIFATTTASVTKTTNTDFSQGTLTTTTVSGSGATAVVQLSGAGGPDNTLYKRSITITNTGGALTDYQVLITLDTASLYTAGKLQATCADIRFRDTNDSTAISNYWVDNCNSTTTRIWVKVPSIAASPATTTIYLYYGSSGASAVSSFANTFTQPSGITGLQLWLKADAITGLSDGAAVSSWTDSSGNGYNATQSTGANQPTYKTSIVNGQPVVRFDGTNDRLTGASSTWHTVLAVVNVTQAGDCCRGLFGAGAGTVVSPGIRLNTPFGSYLNPGDGNDWSNGNGTKFFINEVNTNTYPAVFHIVSAERLNAVSNTYQVSGEYQGARYWYGDMAEIIVYSSALSDANRQSLSRYLAAKYNITLDSTQPTTSVGSEGPTIQPSGTWESATDSNVIDLVWNGGWGDGTSGSTAFSATVANVGTNNTITFSMKTAASTAALTAASYISLGTVNTGTTFTKTKAELDALSIGTGSNRYVQVRAALAQTSGTNPQLDSFTISYLSDNTAPETNASVVAMTRSNGGTTVASNGWTSNLSPYFSWTAGSDTQAGLAGYCLYLGQTANSDPRTSKGLLGTGATLSTVTCPFFITTNSLDLATAAYKGTPWLTTSASAYYVYVTAVDIQGNMVATSTSFQFRFDNTVPTNTTYTSCASGSFSNVADMSFNWPTSGSAASSDSNSGLLGWQYQINSTSGTWLGTTTDSATGLTHMPTSATSRTLTVAQDGSSIVSGANVVYFRTVDAAGNASQMPLSGPAISLMEGQPPAF